MAMAFQLQNNQNTGMVTAVKQERHDEAEIRELTNKFLEQHKAANAKNATAQQQPTRTAGGVTITPGPGGSQTSIMNFMNGQKKTIGPASAVSANDTGPDQDKKASDEESQKGHFGWETFAQKIHIPYIYRQSEKYCAVRIIEMRLLNKYLSYLHQDIYSCTCVRSYYITDAESKLLNEINQRHCDQQFGRELFTTKDLVVRLTDANKFYQFLDICYRKLVVGLSTPNCKCGFIRINKESVVPYTVRDNQKMVPLFYFEGETDNLKLKADYLSGWDLSYLKFCCKVQGIRNELFASDSVAVISLNDIKGYFPPGTEFEDYWPSKVVDHQLLVGPKTTNNAIHWTRQPTHPPPKQPMIINQAQQQQQQQQQQQKAVQQMRKPQTGLYGTGNIVQAQMQAQSQLGRLNSNHLAQRGLTEAVQALANQWTGNASANAAAQLGNGMLSQLQNEHLLRMAQQAQAQAAAQAQAQNQARMYQQAAATKLQQQQLQQQQNSQILQNQLYNNFNMSRSAAQQQQQHTPPPLVRQQHGNSVASHMSNGASGSTTIVRSNNKQMPSMGPPSSSNSNTSTLSYNNHSTTITKISNPASSVYGSGSGNAARNMSKGGSNNPISNSSSSSSHLKTKMSFNNGILTYPKAPTSQISIIPVGSPSRASPKGQTAKQPPGLLPVRGGNNNTLNNNFNFDNGSVFLTKEVELLRETLSNPPSYQDVGRSSNKRTIPSHPYPNPLLDNSRHKSVITTRADVIDLSSPPTRSSMSSMSLQHQQQQQQQQQQQHQQQQRSMNMNGRHAAVMSAAHRGSADLQQQQQQQQQSHHQSIITLPDFSTSNPFPGPAFKVTKLLVEKNMIGCVNMHAFAHTEQLMALSDLKDCFFPNISLESCKRVVTALDIKLYRGNRAQYQAFQEAGKTNIDNMPLVPVREVIQYMPQLTYMVRGQHSENSNATANKRQRIS